MTVPPSGARAAVVGAVASEPRLGATFTSTAQAGAAQDFWSQLVSAHTSGELCQAWLGILCQWIPGTQAGLLLLNEERDRFVPAAVWPDRERDMSHLAGVAQEALVERHGVVRDEPSGMAQCAYPLLGAEETYGVVVLFVVARGEAGMRDALRLLHWGAGWLVGIFDKRSLVERDRRLNRSALLQDLLLGALSERHEDPAARWIVNRLAEALPCRQAMLARVSAGSKESVELVSVSGSAGFESRASLLAAARDALKEAVEIGEPQAYPADDAATGGELLVASALTDYCREAEAGGALALPLLTRGRCLGALLVEAEAPLDAETRGFLETLALALAPCLDVQRAAGRGFLAHARASAHDALRALAGPRAPGIKVLAALGVLALAGAAVLNVDYRVRSPATVEGLVQRAAVAPFAGFIASAPVRAGDTVHAGELLARMDDRDLKLDEAKAGADSELAERKLREALASGDAVAVRVAQADADQAHAELALARERLAHAVILAPFGGRVVSGDLSQRLGAPVEEGQVLFEIAPMHAWRVVLKVDERDIADLSVGESGALVLAGLPGRSFAIKVDRIFPVAQAGEGQNSFRVEARLLGSGAGIEPGMEGVGKVSAGEHALLWVGFHRLFNWLRYTAWKLGL
jgi:RND family efflux transporter MFP subunit